MHHDPINVFLVGMMGAGKSAVGRQLAARLGADFADSDHEIQARTGVSVPVIFEVEGEEGFRRREEQVIDELSQRRGIVVATGGGAVLSPTTRSRLKQRGLTVYLQAKAYDLWLRTRNDRNRPLLDCADPRQRLEDLLAIRDPLYRDAADLVVETGKPSVGRLVEVLVLRIAAWREAAASAASDASRGRNPATRSNASPSPGTSGPSAASGASIASSASAASTALPALAEPLSGP